MKLLRFRVTNFRSVRDSDWIETDDVTALIGTNESGKTNILVPLWKLNPAKDGAIDLIADCPRKHYHDFRSRDPKPRFIEAVFSIEGELAAKIAGGWPSQARFWLEWGSSELDEKFEERRSVPSN
jgi:predicted ATP-binding protein involved in virulence